MTRLRPLLLTLVVALPALAAEPPAPAALFFQYGRSDAWVSYAEARA
jgi:hypothetical protein